MEQTLLSYEPGLFWKYFVEVTKIPHGSKNEGKLAEFVIKTAMDNGLEYKQDKVGNVVVSKPASPGFEGKKTVVLQSHLDMVCEKNEDTVHDFTKDPLKLEIKGNILKACGTTLGADNGVGVAAQLAIMEDKTLKHGPLELLFTIDEETGLTGASNLNTDFLTGSILINLDSEDLSSYCIGCAGGQDTCGTLKLKYEKTLIENPIKVKLELKGLAGGHSGIEINKGRANALKLTGRILYRLENSIKLDVISIKGGSRRNVIPRETFVEIVISKNQHSEFENIIKTIEKELKFEFRHTDPLLTLSYFGLEEKPENVFETSIKIMIIDLLNAFPHGVITMSHDIEGLVETSTNLASVKIEGDILNIETSQRSSIDSAKKAASGSVRSILTLAGLEATSGGGYPGWTPNPESELIQICKELNLKHLKKEAVIEAIHAGLECGLIGEKFPKMEMISMGPSLSDVHSPDEKLKIDTVLPFWNILLDLLLKIAER